MSELGAPPPTYSRQQEGANSRVLNESIRENSEVQMLICPSSDFQFQKGFLGVEGERAAIEGEIQIKGAHTDSWEAVTISLLTTESFDQHQVELNHVQMTLFSRSQPSSSSTIPSSIPFSLPLTPDTAQCIHTPRSSLLHTISVTLHPVNCTSTPLSRSVTVHTRRFSSRRLVLDISPRTVVLEFPARVEVQIPRAIFRSDEIIPIYFVIPPPDRSVVLDQGYTLRNIRAELIRKITLSNDITENEIPTTSKLLSSDDPLEDSDSSSSVGEPPSAAFLTSSASASFSPASRNEGAFDYIGERENSYESTISRSGVSCRFHSTRTVRLRLLLAASSPSSFSHVFPSDLSDSNNTHGQAPDDTQCASVSQSSLIHSVNFFLRVHATYLRSLSHTEFVSNYSIPLVILPPPASLPELEPSMDAAYYKKHDRPPAKTIRHEDSDLYPDDYDENQAGPSAHQLGSPPPFDDAPPPFSSSSAETSASSRLPTFLESEVELHIPPQEHPANNSLTLPSGDFGIEGEGRLFGFPASEQYDGHSDELRRTATPPPTMDMARDDTDVSQLVGLLGHPERVLHALNMTLEQSHDSPSAIENALPPPPPPMDDPSDPPPSIDSDYRTHVSEPPPSIDSDYHNVNSGPTSVAFRPSPTNTLSVRTDLRPSIRDNCSRSHSQSSSPQHANNLTTDRVQSLDISSPEHSILSSPGSQAPPPYLNSISMEHDEHDRHVTHPPPYMDFLPSESHS